MTHKRGDCFEGTRTIDLRRVDMIMEYCVSVHGKIFYFSRGVIQMKSDLTDEKKRCQLNHGDSD